METTTEYLVDKLAMVFQLKLHDLSKSVCIDLVFSLVNWLEQEAAHLVVMFVDELSSWLGETNTLHLSFANICKYKGIEVLVLPKLIPGNSKIAKGYKKSR